MTQPTSDGDTRRLRVLNAGSGASDVKRARSCFADRGWEEVTIDIDPTTRADHIGSLSNMRDLFADGSFDAVWSSHSIEHLYIFELRDAFAEFRRVLRPDGFALITCPDIEAVAAAILSHGLDHVAYVAPAGPITLHDILYGHTASIERGAIAMAHRTGLTAEHLGKLALEAGFPEATVGSGPCFDLWAVLRMPDVDPVAMQATLARSGAAFLFAPQPAHHSRHAG